MVNFVFFLFFAMIIVFFIILFNLFFLKKKYSNENLYPIESGFLSFNKNYFFFNLSFYIMLLLFVLFDIEVIFIIFLPVVFFDLYFQMFFISAFIFFSLVFEWIWGKMMWF